MRVILNTVHLSSERLGGSWIYTRNLIKAIQKQKDDLELIVLSNKSMSSQIAELDCIVETMPVDPNKKIQRVVWEQIFLPSVIKKFSPDIVHATGNVLSRSLAVDSVLTVHDFQCYYYPEYFSLSRRLYLQTMLKTSIENATQVICISEATRNDLFRFFGISAEKVSVVYEAGLDADERLMPFSPDEIKARYGIQSPVILSVGSSLPHKNLERLVIAFAKIVDKVPHDLLIVGESFGFQTVISRFADDVLKSYKQRIRFTGYVPREDLLGLYRVADVFVFPSLFEGFGIPAIESMDCGTPVVASSSTSLPEIIGDAGLYFDPLNPDDIAMVIFQVCTDRGLHKKLKTAGQERAKKFSWDLMALQTLEVYRKILAN